MTALHDLAEYLRAALARSRLSPMPLPGSTCAGWQSSLLIALAYFDRLAALFATTLFFSAFLLFWVQPLLAKMLLPLLGGTPSVWNTCMVFFQVMLLGGYAYAHFLGRRFTVRRQILAQTGTLLVATIVLPLRLSDRVLAHVPTDANPTAWLFGALLLTAGLPFFALSANAPLLQRWFSCSGGAGARDPYFLYAASNFGSLLSLLAYPLAVEPFLRIRSQSQVWAGGFIGLIALVFGCGLLLQRSGRVSSGTLSALDSGAAQGGGHWPNTEGSVGAAPVVVRPRQRFRWCLLAVVPSSLMLGVTTYLTTDVASIPLLWVLPLSLYLLTFVIAFTRLGPAWTLWTLRMLPIAAVGFGYMLLSEASQPVGLLIALHLAVFFIAAMACHGQLAAERPDATRLTEYYLWISVGGVLGGLANALAAPLVFSRIAEYPLSLVVALLLRPAPTAAAPAKPARWLDVAVPLGYALLAATIAVVIAALPGLPVQARLGLLFGIPLLACYAAVDAPLRFGLSLGAVMLVGAFVPGTHGSPLHTERNFFGVLRVTRDPLGGFYRLVHGNTTHGRQALDPARRREPLSYYHRSGPLGQVFEVYNRRPASPEVAVIGLGAGSMACYAQPNERWTFYEINPAVARIAQNTNYFSFLADCATTNRSVVLGDARLRLRDAPDASYGLLVVDAFSSDSIPLHLITREALALYLSKLAPGGLLVFHISNRCLELSGVLSDLARDAGLLCHTHDELDPSRQELAEGADQSHWLMMARTKADLGRIWRDSRWLPLEGRRKPEVWTDDFSNIVSVFKWD